MADDAGDVARVLASLRAIHAGVQGREAAEKAARREDFVVQDHISRHGIAFERLREELDRLEGDGVDPVDAEVAAVSAAAAQAGDLSGDGGGEQARSADEVAEEGHTDALMEEKVARMERNMDRIYVGMLGLDPDERSSDEDASGGEASDERRRGEGAENEPIFRYGREDGAGLPVHLEVGPAGPVTIPMRGGRPAIDTEMATALSRANSTGRLLKSARAAEGKPPMTVILSEAFTLSNLPSDASLGFMRSPLIDHEAVHESTTDVLPGACAPALPSASFHDHLEAKVREARAAREAQERAEREAKEAALFASRPKPSAAGRLRAGRTRRQRSATTDVRSAPNLNLDFFKDEARRMRAGTDGAAAAAGGDGQPQPARPA